MKVLSFGSCLSSNVASNLVHDYSADWCFSIGHNRSDTFLSYYVRKTHEPVPREDLQSVLVPKEAFTTDCELILDNQYPATIGRSGSHEDKRATGADFLSAIQSDVFDLILLDNFMDIGGLTLTWTDHPTHAASPLFFNSTFYSNETWINQHFSRSRHLAPQESASNWHEIVEWIRAHQPTADIVFLCFPHSKVFDTPDRIALATDFYPAFMVHDQGQGVVVIPPLALRPHLAGDPADWTHFAPSAYRALAGHVVLLTGQNA